jgi:hypothetical protein
MNKVFSGKGGAGVFDKVLTVNLTANIFQANNATQGGALYISPIGSHKFRSVVIGVEVT